MFPRSQTAWKKKNAKCLNLILMNTIRRGNDERMSEYKIERIEKEKKNF